MNRKVLALTCALGLLSFSAFADAGKGRLTECHVNQVSVGLYLLDGTTDPKGKVLAVAQCLTSDQRNVLAQLSLSSTSNLTTYEAVANLLLKAKENRASLTVDYKSEKNLVYEVTNLIADIK